MNFRVRTEFFSWFEEPPAKDYSTVSDTYTNNLFYLYRTRWYEHCERKTSFYNLIEQYIDRNSTLIDVGTATGVTSLVLKENGYNVTASDFEGVGLETLRSFCALRNIALPIVPYGNEGVYDWVLAADVLEHAPNPLSFVRWLYNICTVGALVTYPRSIPFTPPYQAVLVDNFVDEDLLLPAIHVLFNIGHYAYNDGGTELVLLRKGK